LLGGAGLRSFSVDDEKTTGKKQAVVTKNPLTEELKK